MKHLVLFLACQLAFIGTIAQGNFRVERDLRSEWMTFDAGAYTLSKQGDPWKANTVYMNVEARQFPGSFLSVQSESSFFLFINGRLSGEYKQKIFLRLDSLTGSYATSSFLVGIHQNNINERDLRTTIVSQRVKTVLLENPQKPDTYFRDFVIAAGLIIIILFVFIMKINPKLASDYVSVNRIFSLREADDSQSNVRLTSSTNIQFYICCSLLIGFYMMMVIHYLPEAYTLPLQFKSHNFLSAAWHWIRLSSIVLGIFMVKILLIFSLTRLFSMRGVARVHFFNWVRVLLLVFGTSSIIVFIYFISRGQQTNFFVAFLSLVGATLIAWVVLAFLKLRGKSEHSLFHLFSYICATEIIPLLITVKVLFQ